MNQLLNEPPKTLLLVNSLCGGGAENVVLMLYREFRNRGLNISLLCLEPPFTRDTVNAGLLGENKPPAGKLTKLLQLFSLAKKLKKKVAEENIDLVQSHIYRANFVNVIARMLGARHKVQIVNHGMPSQYRKQGMAGKVSLMLLRWFYPKADQVVCPSEEMVSEIEALGVTEYNLKKIANPIDINEIITKSGRQITSEKKTVITIGRLNRVKRIEDVIQAIASLRHKGHEVGLQILGSGPEEDSLKALVDDLGMKSHVQLMGWVSNPFPYLAQADVYVSASETEGFSNTIVEALALGVPVVSSDCPGGPAEILQSTPDYGIRFAVGDVPELSLALEQILTDEQLRNSLASRGPERAEAFSKERIVTEYLESIDQLMAA